MIQVRYDTQSCWLQHPVALHHPVCTGGIRVARDKMRFLEEGGVKRVPPECLGAVSATDPTVTRKKSI